MDGPTDIMIASKQVFSFSATFRFNLSRELNSKCARNEARVSPFKIKTKTCAAAADTGFGWLARLAQNFGDFASTRATTATTKRRRSWNG